MFWMPWRPKYSCSLIFSWRFTRVRKMMNLAQLLEAQALLKDDPFDAVLLEKVDEQAELAAQVEEDLVLQAASPPMMPRTRSLRSSRISWTRAYSRLRYSLNLGGRRHRSCRPGWRSSGR